MLTLSLPDSTELSGVGPVTYSIVLWLRGRELHPLSLGYEPNNLLAVPTHELTIGMNSGGCQEAGPGMIVASFDKTTFP